MQLVLPGNTAVRPLAWYLAQEEWLARQYPDREFFFMWQVQPTVIIGRNQLLEAEVNVPFCRSRGIDLVRRRSGGGAVLADMNNIMLSYITPAAGHGSVATTFSRYTSMVARSLRALGLDAADNSRNDILIAGRKVSGNSYYHLGNCSIVHGTMLYDCDTALMAQVLTPPQAKLQSHGVESVRSRITTIREHLPGLSIEAFKAHIEATIPTPGEPLVLTPAMESTIGETEQRYYAPGWLTGRNPRGTLTKTRRIDGVGTLSVHLEVARGTVTGFTLTGDYLETADACAIISDALCGCPYGPAGVSAALAALPVPLDTLIPGLQPGQLAAMIV